MWPMIESLREIVEQLAPAFTVPSFNTCSVLLLGWVMCLGKRTLSRVAQSAHPDTLPDHSQRHDFDSYYNFFERSAWSPSGLFKSLGVLIFSRLRFTGCVSLLVDDTLLHKTGKTVWGLGWFRDAVASTRKRVATAPGHNWVVIAIAVVNPFNDKVVFALPLMARLHVAGKGRPSCPQLAAEMLREVLGHFPGRTFTLVGDGAYACKELLGDLPQGVTFVGRMRSDAAVYDPKVPVRKKGKKGGRKAKKGKKLPSPREAAKKADRKRTDKGDWVWEPAIVTVYGKTRELCAFCYVALWPHVLGYRPVKVVVVRDHAGVMDDIYLFTTDLEASAEWVITQFAWRWSIEVLFRSSKQFMDIEAPQHACRESVEKLAPWVWAMQSVVMVWYLSAGHDLPEAQQWRVRLGPWDSEWSLRHMLRVLRTAIVNQTVSINSADDPQVMQMTQLLSNWVLMAC
jgi:DDE superfamily endonuclease/putative transposase ISC1217